MFGSDLAAKKKTNDDHTYQSSLLSTQSLLYSTIKSQDVKIASQGATQELLTARISSLKVKQDENSQILIALATNCPPNLLSSVIKAQRETEQESNELENVDEMVSDLAHHDRLVTLQSEEDRRNALQVNQTVIDRAYPVFDYLIGEFATNLSKISSAYGMQLINRVQEIPTNMATSAETEVNLGGISVGTNSVWSFEVLISKRERLDDNGIGLIFRYKAGGENPPFFVVTRRGGDSVYFQYRLQRFADRDESSDLQAYKAEFKKGIRQLLEVRAQAFKAGLPKNPPQ